MNAVAAMGGMGPGRMGQGMQGAGMAGMQRAGMPQAEPPEPGGKKPPGNRFKLATENPGDVLVALVDFSRANALQMNILSVNPPSFEDAFVLLTEEATRER
jgi:hypothetical protein